MKTFLAILVLITINFCSSGQSLLNSLVISNTISEKIYVTETMYYADSTKANVSQFLCAKCLSSSSSEIYKQYIRLDIFALDSASLDTIFSRTIDLINLRTKGLNVEIAQNGKSHLPTMHPVDRLRINANGRDLVFKKSDKIAVKTSGGLTVKGVIESYDKESLAIKNGKSTLTISFADLRHIKICRPLVLIGGSFSMFKKCSFCPIDSSLTKTVKQVQIRYPSGYVGWDWR